LQCYILADGFGSLIQETIVLYLKEFRNDEVTNDALCWYGGMGYYWTSSIEYGLGSFYGMGLFSNRFHDDEHAYVCSPITSFDWSFGCNIFGYVWNGSYVQMWQMRFLQKLKYLN
jgi:hypothetical protein